MLNYKNFNQLNENAIDGMVSNIVEEKLLEFLTDRNEDVFLELKEDVNGILMTDEDGNFEYIDEEEYVTLMEHFNVIDEDEGWCVGTVDPIALSGIYENEEMSGLKECVLRIFLDERVQESFIDDVYARVDEIAPLAAVAAPIAIDLGIKGAKKAFNAGKKMFNDYNNSIPKEGKQNKKQGEMNEFVGSAVTKGAAYLLRHRRAIGAGVNAATSALSTATEVAGNLNALANMRQEMKERERRAKEIEAEEKYEQELQQLNKKHKREE